MAEGVKTVEQGDVDLPADRPVGPVRVAPGDLTPFIPERLALAYERRRAAWSTTDTIASWLLAAQLLLLLVIVGRGSLYIDDLRAQGYALNQPFLHFIMDSNGTHFAPLPRTLDWIQSRVFPLQHGPAVAVTLLVRLLLAVGFWRVLRRLFGPRPVTLIPFAMLLLTPALLPATAYYRQSITILACTAAIVWALDLQLRWVLYRHRADLLVLVVVTALGLACYEKAAAIPVILLAATLTIFAGRARHPAQPRPEAPVRAGIVAVLLSAVVVLIFLVIYRSGPYDQGPSTLPSPLDVLRLAGETTSKTIIPLLLGGPFHWDYPVPYAGVAQLSGTAVVFCLVIVLVGLATTFWRSPGRTGRALFLLIAWTLPSIAIVAAGRFDVLGLELAKSARLWADLVPGFLLAGALAALPWRVGVHHQPPKARIAVPEDGIRPAVPLELTVPALAGGLVVLLILSGSVFSSLTYASKWWDNPTGQWIANARLSLENAEPYARTLATPLPPGVMPGWVSWTFPSDAPLLLLLRPDLRFHDGDGAAKVINATGVRSAYIPTVVAQTKQVPLCVATLLAGDTPVTVQLPTAAPYLPGAQIEFGLLLGEPTKVKVTATTPTGKVLVPQRFSDDELQQGPHTLRFPVPYLETIKSVTVQIRTTRTSCIPYVRIWAPVS